MGARAPGIIVQAGFRHQLCQTMALGDLHIGSKELNIVRGIERENDAAAQFDLINIVCYKFPLLIAD